MSNPFSAAWNGLLDLIADGLGVLHGLFEPIFGANAWGWAIIGLTIAIRVLLLPLAVKQFRSMRAMQAIQPRVKKLQEKYKVDRDLMRKDPQAYREKKQKLNEEVMALYREEGVNPAAGCLPLLLQAPIFFALFHVLRGDEHLEEASFYVFSPLSAIANSDFWGWILIALMAATMFWSQRQMMSRNPMAEGPQAQQQKIMLYVMPVFLAFVAQSLPIGVLLYWVTTNFWQMGQQAVMLREAKAHPLPPQTGNGQRAASSGNKGKQTPSKDPSKGGRRKPSPTTDRPDRPQRSAGRNPDHLPRRGGPKGQTR